MLPLTPLHQVRKVQGGLQEVLAQACSDYVTVVLTDKVDLDVIDMQDRLRLAFPGLLEIRRETQRHTDYASIRTPEKILNPFQLCREFLSETDEGRNGYFTGCDQYGSGGGEMKPVKLTMQAFGSMETKHR